MKKYIYSFGGGAAEGGASDMNLLGGKGANLAEMATLGIPVPPGFTISTECCNYYLQTGGLYPEDFEKEFETNSGPPASAKRRTTRPSASTPSAKP